MTPPSTVLHRPTQQRYDLTSEERTEQIICTPPPLDPIIKQHATPAAEFKLAPPLPDLDAQDARSVRSYAARDGRSRPHFALQVIKGLIAALAIRPLTCYFTRSPDRI